MKVAIIGLGVVGQGVYDLITQDFKDIEVVYVLEKDEEKLKNLKHLKAQSFDDIINDINVDVIIELIGGKTIAYELITKALNKQKHVITANKALMSERFEELTKLAQKNNVKLLYEASVAGAIILLDPLKKIREINQIYQIEGILNGSTNFILSKVFLDHQTLEQAILEAFKLGYLEKGSDDDMLGLDALRKINILSMIAYKSYLNEKDILRIPLSSLTNQFMSSVKQKGFMIKYIAHSKIENQILSIVVEPLIIDEKSTYGSIHYEENMVNIYGKYHKKQTFIGQGAGRYPTASAVVYDLLTIKQTSNEDLTYDQIYDINNNSNTHHFLVQTKDKIYKSKLLTYKQITEDKDVICFSRIDEAIYEKI